MRAALIYYTFSSISDRKLVSSVRQTKRKTKAASVKERLILIQIVLIRTSVKVSKIQIVISITTSLAVFVCGTVALGVDELYLV